MNSNYQVVERGSLYSLDYRIYIKGPGGGFVSPWHDIPLYADKTNQVVVLMNNSSNMCV